MSKVLTITIPSYNVEKYLDEIMPHYFDERVLDDLEILIVNDGSKDNTLSIANRYHEMYPNSVFVIDKENGGHGSTVNSGIKAATGKYFKVIDGDDWVDTESFVEFVEVLKNRDTDLVLAPFDKVFEGTNKKEPRLFENVDYSKVYSISEALPLFNHLYQIHSATFKTEVIKKIPAISEHCFYVDQEYVLYPLPFIKTVSFFEKTVYQYRIGTAGQSMATANLQKNRKMHQRVTLNIIRYVTEGNFSSEISEYLNKRAAKLVHNTLLILLSMGNESKSEWVEFSNELKKNYNSIYKNVPGKKAALLRMSNNAVYSLFAKKQ